MSEFIFIRKSRNKISSILHYVLNLLLGIGSIAVTVATGHWTVGVLLVFISKWRIFAVRPHFWFLNLKSNLVDIITGVSIVLLAYKFGEVWGLAHILLAAIYSIWLIIIKPLSNETGTIIQSLFAIFFGTTATILVASSFDSIVAVTAEFIIGYGASRHLLAQKSEGNFTMLSLVCGLLCAEITWLSFSWSIIYTFFSNLSFPFFGSNISCDLIVPQLSIILTIAAFSATKVYYSIMKHDGKISKSDILLPTLFAIITIAVIVIGFSNPIFNI